MAPVAEGPWMIPPEQGGTAIVNHPKSYGNVSDVLDVSIHLFLPKIRELCYHMWNRKTLATTKTN